MTSAGFDFRLEIMPARKGQEGAWNVKVNGRVHNTAPFSTKADAVAAGADVAHELAVDGRTASMRIRNLDGTWSEERTYPRARDPQESAG